MSRIYSGRDVMLDVAPESGIHLSSADAPGAEREALAAISACSTTECAVDRVETADRGPAVDLLKELGDCQRSRAGRRGDLAELVVALADRREVGSEPVRCLVRGESSTSSALKRPTALWLQNFASSLVNINAGSSTSTQEPSRKVSASGFLELRR